MPGKIFDIDEENPNRPLEMLRRAAVEVREVAMGLIVDALDSGIRADEAQAVTDQLIIDALDAELVRQQEIERNNQQDEAINLLILDSLGL